MLMALKLFWSYIRPKRHLYYIALSISTIAPILSLVPAKLTGTLIDKSITGGQTNLLIPLVFALLSVVLVKTLLNYLKQTLFEVSSQQMLYDLRIKLFSNLQNLDNSFYSISSTGDLMAKMTSDLDVVRHMMAWVIYGSYETIIIFFVSLIYLSTINFALTMILLISAPFIVILNYFMFKSLKPVYVRQREAYTELNTAAQENIGGNRVVKAFVREEFEKDKMREKNDRMRDMNIAGTDTWMKFGAPIDFFANLMSIVALVGGAYLVIKTNGAFSVGDLTIFTGLTWALNGPLRMSGPLLNDLQRFSASADKIVSLYYSQPEIKDVENAIEKESVEGRIRFDKVSLVLGGRKILDNISFEINKNETVALMGPTGAGKTMIISLLMRFIEPTSGVIYLDDIDIRKYKITCLRRHIGLSPQDVFLFSNTIEGNIAYAHPEIEVDEVEHFASLAQADSFIKSTPDGYLTIIGERGVGLSGGQKQRISLARALATKAPIIILDDTTSAVDMETEKEIQNSLDAMTECTKIIIAQRISSVYKADKIIIIEDGKITQIGNHNTLKCKKGYYQRVFKIQHGDSIQEEVCAYGA